MQVDRGQQRRVRNVEGQDHIGALALVLQVGDDRRDRVDTEVVGDRLLGAQRPVVGCGNPQRVLSVGQLREGIRVRIEGRGLVEASTQVFSSVLVR